MFPGGGIDMNNMRDTPLLNSSYMSRISSFLGIDFVDRLAKGEVGSAPGPYQTCVAALAYAWTRQRYSGSRPMAVIGQSSGVWAAAALLGVRHHDSELGHAGLSPRGARVGGSRPPFRPLPP